MGVVSTAVFNTPGQDDEDDELNLDFQGLDGDDGEDDCIPLDDDREQVGFELFDWTAPMLDTLDDELHARGLPHEWVSDGFEVVVHEEDEATLDSLVAELVAPFVGGRSDEPADGAELVTIDGDGDGDGDDDDATEVGDDEADESTDETPVAVVDALYQSVTRMRRNHDGDARRDFLDAAEQIEDRPPFGVDGAVWDNVVADFDALIDALVGDEAATVIADRVRALRQRLRPLI